ncbi:MAG: T9SS type A sorting domain-containing protein [Rhodothermia bacterium]|nr:T9SS type A sorting domain-containing protein [Rhodothermia bacterium]
MKKIVTTALFLAAFTVNAWAQDVGFEGTPQIQMNINGTTNWQNPPLTSFSPPTMSSTSTLKIVDAGANIYKNSSGGYDVTGVTFKYRVYPNGGSAPAYTTQSLNFDNQWGTGWPKQYWDYNGTGSTALDINLLSFVSGPSLTYRIDVQFSLNWTGTGGPGTIDGSTYTGTFNVDSSLPISLASFTGTSNEDKATLNWVTMSELNSDHFDVEHSANGSAWKKVGTVQAAGNSIDLRNYSYTVEGLQVGTHSFRLKSVDKNGDIRYTASVQLNVEVPGQYVLYPAYPNPFNPSTTITFAVATRQAVKAEVFNALGQKVQTLFNGTLEANVPQIAKFDAAGLQSGMYIVRVSGANFKATQNVTLLK